MITMAKDNSAKRRRRYLAKWSRELLISGQSLPMGRQVATKKMLPHLGDEIFPSLKGRRNTYCTIVIFKGCHFNRTEIPLSETQAIFYFPDLSAKKITACLCL